MRTPSFALLYALIGTVLILWGLLLPGYILFLDWGVGPVSTLQFTTIGSYVEAPSLLLIHTLSSLFPPWLVQKGVLLTLVFLLLYLPLRYYPWTLYHGAGYVASLIAVMNPFVYERLLAGQWRVLAGYAGLFPLFYTLVKYQEAPSLKRAAAIALVLFLIGLWSIHFLAIGIVLSGVFFVCLGSAAVWQREWSLVRAHGRHLLALGGLVCIGSLYWLIPVTLSEDSGVNVHFAAADYQAFATVRDPVYGAIGNVLTLRGFWLEDEPWAEQFTLPGSEPWLFYSAALALLLISGLGWYQLVALGSSRTLRATISTVFILSSIFAVGISGYGVWLLNLWLLEHVPLWNGFREPQKWAGVLAVLYAVLFPLGIYQLTKRLPYQRVIIAVVTLLLVLCLSPRLLFGLGGQVTPVWYPESWQEVNTLLKAEPECRAVFLPWHMYYSLPWNNSQLTINPANRAFDCEMVVSRRVNLGDLPPLYTSPLSTQIDARVVSLDRRPEAIAETIAVFREAGITHVIVSTDFRTTDPYPYHFLASDALEVVSTSNTITLYRLQ